MSWNADPPQGKSNNGELVIIGKPLTPRFGSPQGDANVPPPPLVEDNWIDDLGEQFIDDLGNEMVFGV